MSAQKDIPKGGRPSKYLPKYNKLVEKLCKAGFTDKELADVLEVNEDTIHEWKKVYPRFSESIKKGKAIADANVAQSLYERAIGYKHSDVDLKLHEGKIIETKIIKHYPPDTTAAIFWLKNRQKEKWRDKHEVDLGGGVSFDVVVQD